MENPYEQMDDLGGVKTHYFWVDTHINQGSCCKFTDYITLPETNIFAPENGWLEYYFPIGMTYFKGRTVRFREGNIVTNI